MEINNLTETIIGSAMEVHRHLGPGLLESVYVVCLRHELASNGISFQHELPLPVQYKGIQLDCGYRLDLLVAGAVVVEVKAVEKLNPIHEAGARPFLRRRTAVLSGFRGWHPEAGRAESRRTPCFEGRARTVVHPHEAQLLTYLRLGGWKVGLLLNFNVPLLKDGIKRRVLGL